MHKRLFFVLPDLHSARAVEKELLLARIGPKSIHFLAKRGTDLSDLPEATMFQKTDFVQGIRRGLFFGGVTGTAVGTILYMNPDLIGHSLNMGAIFLFAAVGAVIGGWASGMIGTSTPNSTLKEFDGTIEEGHILMILDISSNQVDQVRDIITSHHPEAEDHGLDPNVPIFP
jgi:hypothetical protein